MDKTWRERVTEIKDHPSLALLGVGIEDLCNEAASAALEEGRKEVWEAMRTECISYCCDGRRCANIMEGAPDLCTLAACPLLDAQR